MKHLQRSGEPLLAPRPRSPVRRLRGAVPRGWGRGARRSPPGAELRSGPARRPAQSSSAPPACQHPSLPLLRLPGVSLLSF